jgi:molecular chaperone HtpG
MEVFMKTQNLLKDGMLSIESKNIFTILKKWLYTETDIVFRELISNASDAIEKLNQIQLTNNYMSSTEGKINVELNVEEKTLIIKDNGIGMTEEEVDKYINQIAFSGASEFIANTQSGKDSIIGHFGVGFYSAFMLTDHVAIETKSYKNATAVRWDCKSDMAYEMKESDKTETGTEIILYLNENNTYLNNPELIFNTIKKYFVFSKIPIYFTGPGFEKVKVNVTEPIWKKSDDKIDKSEMDSFYMEFFKDVSSPLFWIKFESLDIGIRGILFFRDTKNGTDEIDGTIKVYSRGVYIGENIKSLIPKYVNLQNGIIECDNLPLVVSRSTIRSEDQKEDVLSLIYESLTQEVTIAINEMFTKKRELYEKYWSNLNAFVKYAVLQDKVFASVMTKKVIFEDIYGKYQTINEYIEKFAASNHPDTIYYTSDKVEQAHYIEIFKKCNLNALLFDHVIDQPFMRKYEVIKPNLKFIRIDSNIESLFKGYMNEGDEKKASVLKSKIEEALKNRLEDMDIKVTNLEQQSISTLIINDEKSRRMADMLEIYGYINPTDVSAKKFQSNSTLLVNMNNPIIRCILESNEAFKTELLINHLYDLSLMSQQALKPEDVEAFICRSETILTILSDK